MDDELVKLYDLLVREGYYTKTWEEFAFKYLEEPEYKEKVFDVVSRDGFYTKSKEEFLNQYKFPEPAVKKKDDAIPSVSLDGDSTYTEQPEDAFFPQDTVDSEAINDYSLDFSKQQNIIRSQEDVEKASNIFNEETKKYKEDIDSWTARAQEIKVEYNDKFGGLTEEQINIDPSLRLEYNEFKERDIALQQEYADLVEREKYFKEQGARLDKMVGDFVDVQSQKGNWAGGIWNSVLSGVGSISAGQMSMLTDFMVEYFPTPAMGEKGYRETFISAAEQLGYSDLLPEGYEDMTVAEIKEQMKYSVPEEPAETTDAFGAEFGPVSFQQYGTRSAGKTLGQIIDEKAKDNAKKGVKFGEGYFRNPYSFVAANTDPEMGIVDATREGARELFGDKGTTEQWRDMQKEGFWGGAILGLAESLPAMAGGAGPVGWAQRTANMYALTTDQLNQEMESNPEFDDISESEKYYITAPVGVTVAVLETYGFRNVINQKGLLNSLVAKALGRSTKSTSAKTFSQFIREDVENMMARGILTVGAGGLAEFETGAAQQAAEITIKEIYNISKEKDMFQTPNTWIEFAGEVLKGGAQEAVGGFVLSTPGAVINAVNNKEMSLIDDDAFNMLKDMSTDSEFTTMYGQSLRQKVSAGEMTEAEAKQNFDEFNRIIGVTTQIPTDLNIADQKKALELLVEKKTLDEQIQGKDKSLVKDKTDRIKEIDAELVNMAERRNATYLRDGKFLSREQFIEQLEAATPEEITEGAWEATNDSEVTDLLADKFSAVEQEAAVEEVIVEEPAVEEPIAVEPAVEEEVVEEAPVTAEEVLGEEAPIAEAPAEFSAEDQAAISDINTEIRELSRQFGVAETVEEKQEARSKLVDARSRKAAIESKYLEDVSQEEAGVPSPVEEGQAVVEGEPIEEAGVEEVTADRDVQAPEEVTAEEAVTEEVPAEQPIVEEAAVEEAVAEEPTTERRRFPEEEMTYATEEEAMAAAEALQESLSVEDPSLLVFSTETTGRRGEKTYGIDVVVDQAVAEEAAVTEEPVVTEAPSADRQQLETASVDAINLSDKAPQMIESFNSALSSIGAAPVNVYVVSDADMQNVTGSSSRAQFRTLEDGTSAVVVNADKASLGSLSHEMMHAYVKAVDLNSKQIVRFTNEVRSQLNKGTKVEKALADKLTAFQKEYLNREVYGKGLTLEDAVIAEEFLAEFVAEVKDGIDVQKMSLSTIERIRKAVVRILNNILGLKIDDTAIKSKEEAFDFINGFLDALEGRTAVAEEAAPTEGVPTEEQGESGQVGTISIPREQIKVIDAPKASDDPRGFVNKFVTDIDINELEGRNFVTNMYDYTSAGTTELGNGISIELLGGRNYVPLMLERNGKELGEVSNLAAFNSESQAEGFIRNAKEGNADLFAPHSGTLKDSWQFQHHIFEELVKTVLDNKIMSKARLMEVFNGAIKSKAGAEAFEAFNKKNKSRLKNLNSFKKNPMKLVELLDADNNYSPDLRKALNQKIAASKEFQKAIGIKNLNQFYNLIADPLNQGVEGGEVMSFVEFDPNTFEISKTKPGDPDHHPSFGWTVKAKIKRILQPNKYYKSYDLTNEYTKYNVSGPEVSTKEDPKFAVSNVKSSAGAIPKVAKVQAREQIDWESSKFGKGQVNPAIVNRSTPVQEAALDLLQGKISNAEYQETVRITQPVEPITRFFLPASTKDMREALDSNKGKILNTAIEDGKEVGLRLDIPAYKNRNIWVVSVHDSGKAGKSISYGSVAWATDVQFGSNPKVAAFIAAGKNIDTGKKQDKTTIARMHGKWKNFDGKTKEERDASAVKKVEEIVAIESSYPGAARKGSPWRQIGMNPFRHSYFYDRRTGKPVVAASEVVQIGGLVYAKDVVYADKNDPVFEVQGYKDSKGETVRFQIEDQVNQEKNSEETYSAINDNKEGVLRSQIDNKVDQDVAASDTWKSRERNVFERFVDLTRRKIQDSYRDIIVVQEDIEYATRKPVGLDQDFRNAEVLMHGAAKNELNKTENRIKDIAGKIKKSGLSVEEVNDLLYAMHAQERNRYLRTISTDIGKSLSEMRKKSGMTPTEVSELLGISKEQYLEVEANKRDLKSSDLTDLLLIYGSTPYRFFYDNALVKDGSGMTDVEARKILAKYDLNLTSPDVSQLSPKIRPAVTAIRELIADTRNRLVESGLESQGTIDAFNAAYKNYVPLRGFADEQFGSEIIEGGGKLEVRAKEKRAKGRKRKADSPLTQAIISNTTTIIRGAKNDVMRRFYELAKDNPNKDIYEVVDPEKSKDYKTLLRNGKVVAVAKSVSDYLLDEKMVSVRIDGDYKFIRFDNVRLANAIRGANVTKSQWLTKYLGAFNRFQSALITTYDPGFIFRNFTRDIQTAVLNLYAEQDLNDGLIKDKDIVGKTIDDVYPASVTIFAVEGGWTGKKEASRNKDMDQYYREFLEDGAKTEWFYSKPADQINKDIEKLIRGKGDNALKAAANLVERINSSVENAVRLSAYVNARKAGVPRAKAAELAKNLTVNFNKSGEWGQIGNSLYLFFNASVQGSSRLLRTLKPAYKIDSEGNRKYHLTRAQKMVVGLYIMGSLFSLYNELKSDEDEDGESFYSKIADFEKERNIIIMKPNGKDYWKMPLPYGQNTFYVAGSYMAEGLMGTKTPGEVASAIVQAAVGSFSPINFPNSKDASSYLVKFALPTIGQIPLSIALNENYFGEKIYRENFPFDPAPKPDSQLGKESGYRWTQAAAKWLNEFTGGSEYRSGYIDWNPDNIDFVVETLTGGAGKFATRSVNAIDKILTGNWDQLESRQIPFVRIFNGQPYEYSNINSFYERTVDVNQKFKEVKAGIIKGPDAKKIYEMHKMGKDYKSRLKKISKLEDEAAGIKDPLKQEARLDKLEKARYKLVADFNKRYIQLKIEDI